MPSFTLIIPTLGRTVELDRLFASLAAQDFPRFHCLVIDQNAGDLIDDVLERFASDKKHGKDFYALILIAPDGNVILSREPRTGDTLKTVRQSIERMMETLA